MITHTSFKSICKLETSIFVSDQKINTSPLLAFETSIFSDNGKIAHVTPGYKTDKKDRQNKSHYRPISVIGVFSKIIERYIEMKTSEHIESILSIFIAAYRKKYSCNSVLIRLVENWKKQLDNKKFVGAVLMDLSKAFDCVPHDLLIAKMHAYGFEMDTLVLFFLLP